MALPPFLTSTSSSSPACSLAVFLAVGIIAAGTQAAYYGRLTAPDAGDLGYFSPPFEGGTVDLSYANGAVSILSHAGQGSTNYPASLSLIEWEIKMGTCRVAEFECPDFQLGEGDYLNVANVGGSNARNVEGPFDSRLFYHDFRVSFSSRLAGGAAAKPVKGFACFVSCLDYTHRKLSSEISVREDLAACSANNDGQGVFFTSHEGLTESRYANGVGRTEYNFDASNCPNSEGVLACDILSLARRGRKSGRCIDTLELKGSDVVNGSVVPATWLGTGRTRTCLLPSGGISARSEHRTGFVGHLDVVFRERARAGKGRTRRGFSCAAACRDFDVPSCNLLTVVVLGHEYASIRGALVSVNDSQHIATDKSGRAHFYLTQDASERPMVEVNVIDPSDEHFDVYDYKVTLDISGRTTVTIALTRVVRVFMKVVSAVDGLPPDNVNVYAWDTHGIHCPNNACDLEDSPNSGGQVSFVFPAGVPFLTVDVRHKFHQPLENFGVIIPSGSSNVTIECPIVISPTRPLQLNITAVDVNNQPVPHARIVVDQGPEQEADGSGSLIVFLPTPSLRFDFVNVFLEGHDRDDTKYGSFLYQVEEGQFEDTYLLTLHPIVDVRVNVTGVSGRTNLGPIEGVSMRFGRVPLYSSKATGADGVATLRFVNTARGGSESIVVLDNGVPGYTQLDGSVGFGYNLLSSVIDLKLQMHRTCAPSWEGTVVESLRYTSRMTPSNFQLQFTQVADFVPEHACTQPTNDCDTDLTHIQGIHNSNPVINQGFLDSTADTGYVYVSVIDTIGGALSNYEGEVSLLDSEGNYLANVTTPPRPFYDATNSEWSVGCVDLSTKKFYCLNVIEMGDLCPSVIPHIAAPHSYA